MTRTMVIAVFLTALLVLSVAATASMIIPADENAKGKAKAPEKSPVIGDSWDIERIDFIHYAKPESPGGGKPGAGKPESCYKLMGVKWKTLPVSYAINPTNPGGLVEEFVTATFAASAETWDAATSVELFSDAYTVDYTAQYGVYDHQNSIAFGDYPQSGVIAVTSVWYTRVGKQIVEFDMLFDTDYAWGDATLDPGVMDFANIATHELGHSVGLGDIYSSACSGVTMYGYSDYGETSKRTLEQPDITGLQAMYGQ